MQIGARIAAGLVALLFLVLGLGVWFNMDQTLQGFAFAAEVPLARAAVRADFGGFFFGIAIMAGMAAWRKSASWALGAALLVSLAFTGRAVSLAMEGPAAGGAFPMGVEAACAIAMFWARSVFRKG
jgi:hypothetical protein